MDVRWRWRWRDEQRGDGEETALNTHQRLSGESDGDWQTGGAKFAVYSKVLNERKVFFVWVSNIWLNNTNWTLRRGSNSKPHVCLGLADRTNDVRNEV